MRLRAGVTRCLLLYVVLLLVPTIVAPQPPPAPPPIPPGFPGDDPETDQLAPGWYKNSGPSIIYEDEEIRISWENSYIYPYQGENPLYWYVEVVYFYKGSQTYDLSCAGEDEFPPVRAYMRGATDSGYADAEESLCSHNPALGSTTLKPGESFTNWVIFSETPGTGDEVSLEWDPYGSSEWVAPWSYPFDAPPPPVCPEELVTLGMCQLEGALFIDRVWTTDGNGIDKTTFMPGDAIRYTTLIRNTYNRPVKSWIRFGVVGPTGEGLGNSGNPASRDIYTYIQRDIVIPVGQSANFSSWTIPDSAQPGSYDVEIIICWDEASVTTDSSCSGTSTVKSGSFTIPGSLATTMTTFLSDGVTPTSATDGTGPGEALFYKITVTNTGFPAVNNTNVVLTDPLPKEIFNLISPDGISDIFTDHGTCEKVGSWPITVTCQLGSLTFGKTATIYFKASIIVRDPSENDPSGRPQPPGSVVNTANVSSDQQTSETSASVETLINVDDISCEDFQDLVAIAKVAAGVIVGSPGSFAGLVWNMVGGLIPTTCQPKPFPEIPKDLSKAIEELVKAIDTKQDELIFIAFEFFAQRAGMSDVFSDPGSVKDLADAWMRYRLKHNQ